MTLLCLTYCTFDSFLLSVFLIFCSFILPKVVFHGIMMGEPSFVALDDVVFSTDRCRERPLQCKFLRDPESKVTQYLSCHITISTNRMSSEIGCFLVMFSIDQIPQLLLF